MASGFQPRSGRLGPARPALIAKVTLASRIMLGAGIVLLLSIPWRDSAGGGEERVEPGDGRQRQKDARQRAPPGESPGRCPDPL